MTASESRTVTAHEIFNTSGNYTSAGKYRYGTKIDKPVLSKPGYEFVRWTYGDITSMPDYNLTLTAIFKEADNSFYTVEHYKQKLDGTYNLTPDEREVFEEASNAIVTPEVKSYTGFTSPENQSVNIKSDGSTVIKYQYIRNTYRLIWNFDGGSVTEPYTSGYVMYGDKISLPKPIKEGYEFDGWDIDSIPSTMPAYNLTIRAYWIVKNSTVTFDVNGGKALAKNIKNIKTNTVYGELPKTSRIGYTFSGWYTAKSGGNKVTPDTICEGDITLYAHWKAMTNTKYTVEHYKQKLDGKYKKIADETEAFTGTTNASVTPATKNYIGFNAPETKTDKIKADGTLVIKYYYKRNSYQLTWNLSGGTVNGSYTKGSVKYGTIITAPIPTRDGYEFTGWDKTVAKSMPAKDVTYKAKWQKKASTKRELIEQFAERMYTKALGRGADPDGLKYWADRLEKQIDDGANMAYGFITSEEFKARKLSDDQFIETMYQTFFGRTADSTGKTFWMNQIKSGASRETVLAGFVKSEEFGKLCSDAGIERGLILEDGTPVNAGIYQFVKRQYTCCLQREGDRDGIDYWATKIAKHEVSAVDTAKEFFFSTEFESKGLSDKQFVERLYETFLGRPFDETGYAYWNDKMSKGETRREVIDEFASSEEFKGILRGYGL